MENGLPERFAPMAALADWGPGIIADFARRSGKRWRFGLNPQCPLSSLSSSYVWEYRGLHMITIAGALAIARARRAILGGAQRRRAGEEWWLGGGLQCRGDP